MLGRVIEWNRLACPYTGGASNLGVVPMYQILLASLRLATEVIKLLTAAMILLAEVTRRKNERRGPTANSTGSTPRARHLRQK